MKKKLEEKKKMEEEIKKKKAKEMKEKAIDVAAGVGSAVGTGAAVAGGVVLVATEAVILPIVLFGVGAAALGLGVIHAVKKLKQTREKMD